MVQNSLDYLFGYWFRFIITFYRAGLDLDLDNSCWIEKIPNLGANNIEMWFFAHYTLMYHGKLDLIALLTESLTDDSRPSSYFYYSIPAWLNNLINPCPMHNDGNGSNGDGKFLLWRDFLLGGGNLRSYLWGAIWWQPFSKLKTTFCKYWTSIIIKIGMTFVYKEYEVKYGTIKMVEE